MKTTRASLKATTALSLGLFAAVAFSATPFSDAHAQAAAPSSAAPAGPGTLGTATAPGGGGSTMVQGTAGQTGTTPGTTPGTMGAAPSAMAPATSSAPSTEAPAAGAPVAGANSFTEGQARARITEAGFADVGELQRDANGIWRGRGTRNGTQADVAMDYQSNVTAGGQPVR